MTRCARAVRVRGVVQGVGFRPFVYRLALANTLAGWVLNAGEGVEIYLEGAEPAIDAFMRELKEAPPPAANIAAIEVVPAEPSGLRDFTIRISARRAGPTVRISPDLPICEECLDELFDPADARYGYPYINCANCGPRYSVVLGLPYDRSNTTMRRWPTDRLCEGQYRDPSDRRFHAQPVACPACGPHFSLQYDDGEVCGDGASIRGTAGLLREGMIVAIKGLGGYHLTCDARNADAVRVLRERKYRKEKPFAVMAASIAVARALVSLSPAEEELLCSTARPIVLARALERTGVAAEIAPDCHELGVMLPYTPLHHLLFAAGAPEVLVMTSANRSSEPIAYEDDDALERLSGIADAFLIGERPIARRVDDSVARAGAFGPVVLRRARGYAPGAVARLPTRRPILALGADLKNTVTLVVAGQTFVSQHIGDLDHYESFRAFEQTIEDLVSMYEVSRDELLVVHDCHPEYLSTHLALDLPAAGKLAVQHHRAHIASVLAERGQWEKRVLGVSFDGAGYGDDGSIWGGEFFTGSVAEGFCRVAHLRTGLLPGGDAAASNPVQAAAGFLTHIEQLPDLTAAPFRFPSVYDSAVLLARKGVRAFRTTSVGRLFDAAAALLGFTRPISFEGQAAMWVEHLARSSSSVQEYPFPQTAQGLDFEPLLRAVVDDRVRGSAPHNIARAFQRGIARGLCDAVLALCHAHTLDTVVLSGGVFQNELLLEDLRSLLDSCDLQIWTNRGVPPNDGGISLGQAAMAAFG